MILDAIKPLIIIIFQLDLWMGMYIAGEERRSAGNNIIPMYETEMLHILEALSEAPAAWAGRADCNDGQVWGGL